METFKLQAVLSSCSGGHENPFPHHPITCAASPTLRFHEDGSLACEHITTKADDARTRECLNHSVAILLMELAERL